MQDFVIQAKKNNIELGQSGPCQFCGTSVTGGVFECMKMYNEHVLGYELSQKDITKTRFLNVDAHALQHSEIHGEWSDVFHLVRMSLILEHGIHWKYELSPLLSDYLKKHKNITLKNNLPTPNLQERGDITVVEIKDAVVNDEYSEYVMKWAEDVYHAWAAAHKEIAEIVNGFIE